MKVKDERENLEKLNEKWYLRKGEHLLEINPLDPEGTWEFWKVEDKYYCISGDIIKQM